MTGDSRTPRWRAYLALLLAINGTGWSAIFVRWAGVPGASSAFYRTLIAALVLVPWRLLHRGRPVSGRRPVLLALAGGAFFAFDLALYNTAVLRTKAATAALLGNLTPMFVGLLTWIVFRRRPDAAFWTGLLLSTAGCAAIVGVDALRPHTPDSLTGDMLGVGAAVFFAAYLLTTERVRTTMDTLTFNTIAIVGSAVTLLIISVLQGNPLSGYSARAWLALLALGLVSQLGAYLALVYALGHLPATITAVGLLAQVPLTAVLAMIFLREPLTGVQLLGGGVVLLGIWVVSRKTQQPRYLGLHSASSQEVRMDNQTGDRNREQGTRGDQSEGNFGQKPGTSDRDADLQREGNLGNERTRGGQGDTQDDESRTGNRQDQNR